MQFTEVYDDDAVNDQRMAVDLYDALPLARKYFVAVRSATVDGCSMTADHATPGRNPSERQREYGVFRPLDAALDCAFTGKGCAALAAMGAPRPPYRPREVTAHPVPAHDQTFYRNPWTDPRNPRAGTAP